MAPEVRFAFPKIAELSPVWAGLIEAWDDIEGQFLEEAGLDWCKARRAPKTYTMIKKVREAGDKIYSEMKLKSPMTPQSNPVDIEAIRARANDVSSGSYHDSIEDICPLCDEVESLRARVKELEASANDWMEQARQFCGNMEYYRGLLDRCAPYLGDSVYIQDDGNRSDSILRAKIPELVALMFGPIPPPVEPTKGETKV
jgi:hypothetical protein